MEKEGVGDVKVLNRRYMADQWDHLEYWEPTAVKIDVCIHYMVQFTERAKGLLRLAYERKSNHEGS